MKISQMNIGDLLGGYKKGQFKPSEVVSAYVKAIEDKNNGLNAYLEVRSEQAIEKARNLDAKLGQMHNFPLFGIPIAVKDLFLIEGWRTTAGSKMLGNYMAPYTATAIERLERSGVVILGKTNLDEFAMGSSNENSAFGPVRNPWATGRVSGGSSGGSAASVAAGMAAASLGTDTGGSIRQPASFCGIVGLKPSYGRVSRYGIVAFASSLDQVGPLAMTVGDSVRLFAVIAGHDPRDATTSQKKVPSFAPGPSANAEKGLRVGIFKQWLEGVDDAIRMSFDEAISALKSAGARIVEIALPNVKYSVASYYLIAPSEASSNLARYDGVHVGSRAEPIHSVDELYHKSRGAGFGGEVKRRIMLGTYALSAGYYDAFISRPIR